MPGRIVSVNIGQQKREKKSPVSEATLQAGYGVIGDSHAGAERQVSLLSLESIENACGQTLQLSPGDFGENITTEGIDWSQVQIGERFRVGEEAIIQISEKGKICHSPCDIGKRLGECIMPREGVFARVVRGGRVQPGHTIEPTTTKVGAVVTLSDRCTTGERTDESGPVLMTLLKSIGVELVDYTMLPDEEMPLREKLISLCDDCGVDLILTTGGTGFSLRDRTPEATLSVITSPAPGFAEAIRHEGLQFTPFACISRGVSGLRDRTLIVNLPGSRRAVSQVFMFLEKSLPHALDSLRTEVRDCVPMPSATIEME